MGKNIWKIVIAVVLVAALGAAGYFYYQYRMVTGATGDKEVKLYVEQIGKLIILPDEVPTLATVTDKSKLANQKFFRSAQNGDKVLIFPLASKAILYRPRINKIVEIASISDTNQGAQNPSSKNAELTQSKLEVVGSTTMTLALYNGTKSIGLTNTFEKTILDKVKDVEIATKENATGRDYQRTIIVDISGKYKQRIDDLSKLLDAKLSILPDGEIKPNADILIILGKSSLK